jgi:ribosomal protein S5
MAGIQDCYSQTRGSTKTRFNFLKATFAALEETYKFLTPDFWGESIPEQTPFEKFHKFIQFGNDNKDDKET